MEALRIAAMRHPKTEIAGSAGSHSAMDVEHRAPTRASAIWAFDNDRDVGLDIADYFIHV
jgi:hypothetical protein